MSDNFEFIKDYKNIYENVKYAEKLLDTSTSVLELGSYENQMRKTIETMINKLIKEYGVACDERLDLRNKIDILYSNGIIDSNSKDNYHTMRMEGNPGSHAHETMDTRSAKNYYDEKRRKDVNAFKRLFVECHAFVEIYMPKASQYNGVNPYFEEDKKLVNIYQDKSESEVKPVPKQSSVTYGSSKNKDKFTEEIQYHNYSLAAFSFLMGFFLPLGATLFIFIYGGKNDTINDYIFVILVCISFICTPLLFAYPSIVSKKNKYTGIVKFGNHTLTISRQGTKWEALPVKVNLDNEELNSKKISSTFINVHFPAPISREERIKIRKNGQKSSLYVSFMTPDGYFVEICEFFVEKYYIRYDIYLNGQLIVEEEMIHTNTIREIENSMK